MTPILAIAMLFCAIVGGVIGWRRASTPLQRRLPSEKHTTPEEAAHWAPLKLDFFVYLFDIKLMAQAYAGALKGIRAGLG